MGCAACAIAMDSDAGRCSMCDVDTLVRVLELAVPSSESMIRHPIVLGDYWCHRAAFGMRGVCVERVYATCM